MKQLEYSLAVDRGGSWLDNAGLCRSAYRIKWRPCGRSDLLGFRIAREIKNETV